VIVWQAALDVVRRNALSLALLLVLAIGLVAIVNLPFWPVYERGLLTGIVIVTLLWAASWSVWVTSGLAHRLNGVWAEEVTNEELKKHPNSLGLLANYKFDGWDIDSVLVTRSAVYAVECKWRGSKRSDRDFHYELLRDAKRLQRNVVQFRDEMAGMEVPESWIRGLLVVRGPAAHGLESRLMELPDGSQVRVVSGDGLAAWLESQSTGKIGPDFAGTLIAQLTAANAVREAEVEVGPVMRWVARVR
jgi:hypothetical protein